MRKRLPIPPDLQEQRDARLSYRKLASRYGVSLATIQRWLKKVYLRPGRINYLEVPKAILRPVNTPEDEHI